MDTFFYYSFGFRCIETFDFFYFERGSIRSIYVITKDLFCLSLTCQFFLSELGKENFYLCPCFLPFSIKIIESRYLDSQKDLKGNFFLTFYQNSLSRKKQSVILTNFRVVRFFLQILQIFMRHLYTRKEICSENSNAIYF